MTHTVKDLLETANAAVPKISVAEAKRMAAEENALIVDVRDGTEAQVSGRLRGAHPVSRGMLEFRADPGSKYHDPAFDAGRPVVLYCASGGRAALAGQTLQQMGYDRVYNLGGFQQAVDDGMEVDPAG